MKTIKYWAIMAAAACMCMTACKGKTDKGGAQSEEQSGNAEQVESVNNATTSAEGVNLEQLDELGYMVCPLCIQDKGKVDENGEPVTVERKWICGSGVGVKNMMEWVLYTQDPRFAFNLDGWHFVGKDIVNADETYKMNDEDAMMSLSSYCTIRTEKYTKPEQPEQFEPYSLSTIYLLDPDYDAPKVFLTGNQHTYDDPELKELVENKGESSDYILTSFYKQEWITVTLTNYNNQKLVVMPYQYNYENVIFNDEKLAEAVWSGTAEQSEEGMTAQFYVGDELPVGFYDLLVIDGEQAKACVTMALAPTKQ